MYKKHNVHCLEPLQTVQYILSRVAGGCSCRNLFIEQVKAVRSGLLSPCLMKTQIPLTPVNWLGGVKCLPTRPHPPTKHPRLLPTITHT